MLRNWKKRRNYNRNKEKEIKNGSVERNNMKKRKSTKPNFKIFENINTLINHYLGYRKRKARQKSKF